MSRFRRRIPCNDAEFDEAAGEQIHGLVLEPTMVKRGHYRRSAERDSNGPVLYQEFDEENGYTFTIV
jgi:hypothetical protein